MTGSRDASGPDPMHDRRVGVDEPHAMSTELRYALHHQLDELEREAAGRFGRQVPKIDCADLGQVPSRKAEVEKMRQRMKKSGYQVDTAAVATAILERLAAGGLTPPAPKS